MSDAPETIWADNCGHYWNGGNIQGLTQYTRTDTIDAIKAQVWQEAIEAAAIMSRSLSVVTYPSRTETAIRAIPNPHEVVL